MSLDINCDMGESFGIYNLGDDEALMPYITEANIACGFHASDPNHMMKTVSLAKKHGVRIGAHFSLPDLVGFGRREMKIDKEELFNNIIYQVGALMGFLDVCDVELSHLKPHGALYGMASKQEQIAEAIAEVGEHYKVPILGMVGTVQEEIYNKKNIEFRSEFFADLDYDGNGGLLITREHHEVSAEGIAKKCVRAIEEGVVKSIDGTDVPVNVETICVHSDTPNAVEVAKSVYSALKKYL